MAQVTRGRILDARRAHADDRQLRMHLGPLQIDSLPRRSKKTVFDETIEFNERVKAHSRARLVDENRAIVDVASMGFTMKDRFELVKLVEASEEALGASRITDWLSPEFFTTKFWYMWATTFAFQPWHSAVEFRRYLHRFIKEFSRIETPAGVKRTIFNQYDSLVRPLESWLEQRNVRFMKGCTVTDLDLATADGKVAVARLTYRHNGKIETVIVGGNDLVFFQNASMTDASSLGSMSMAPEHLTKNDSGGWALWEKVAKNHPRIRQPFGVQLICSGILLGIVHCDAEGLRLLR